jgi:hypothetical protein
MICRDALRGKPESVGVYASERLSFSFSERPQGKPRSKPNREIRLPGLQGGPRKRDFVVQAAHPRGAEPFPLLAGSLVRQYVICGKPGCRCGRGQRDGPLFYFC